MMAFIFLLGLVTKNAILLIDYANTLRVGTGGGDAAMRKAVPVRLRPILMTTVAMIFGMLPTAVGRGEGSEGNAPMAIAIIGGLVSSTLLTLLVVPVVYSLLDPLSEFIRRKVKSEGSGEHEGACAGGGAEGGGGAGGGDGLRGGDRGTGLGSVGGCAIIVGKNGSGILLSDANSRRRHHCRR